MSTPQQTAAQDPAAGAMFRKLQKAAREAGEVEGRKIPTEEYLVRHYDQHPVARLRRHRPGREELPARPRRARPGGHGVAKHRNVVLEPAAPMLVGYGALAQPKWDAWRKKAGVEALCEESLDEQMRLVCAIVDPVFEAAANLPR